MTNCQQSFPFASTGWCDPVHVNALLAQRHYLGPTHRGVAWKDEYGVLVLSNPTSRMLPQDWLELSRWCIVKNAHNVGSMQWARVRREILRRFPQATTVVSYSDPAAGHNGALYRASNWWWAPTWHRLRPPPSGLGSWDGLNQQQPKDRWVCALRPDSRRVEALAIKDESVARTMPWACYKEPGGAEFRFDVLLEIARSVRAKVTT